MQGGEEQKGQYDDGDSPSGIPRKAHGFIISEKNEGEFVMLQSVPLFKFLINGIGHRDSIIASYQPPRIRFHRLLIFYDKASTRGQAPYTKGLAPDHHPFCLAKKTGLSKGYEKE